MALHSLYCADVPLRKCSVAWVENDGKAEGVRDAKHWSAEGKWSAGVRPLPFEAQEKFRNANLYIFVVFWRRLSRLKYWRDERILSPHYFLLEGGDRPLSFPGSTSMV